MPSFIKAAPPTATSLSNFSITAAVSEDAAGALTVGLTFYVQRVSAQSIMDAVAGDLAPFLTAQQITNFTSAATSLYNKAKTELLG